MVGPIDQPSASMRDKLPIDDEAADPVPAARLDVLYVVEAFGGGVFEMTRQMAEGLAERGHRATIAYGIRPETPADVRAAIDPGVGLIAMPWTDRSLRAQVRALRSLRRVVEEVQPDVVHLISSYAGVHGALTLARGIPTIYTPQGYAFTMGSRPRRERGVFRAAEWFVSRRVSVVVACSHSEAEQARSVLRAPRVGVVENGIVELDHPGGRRPSPGGPRVVGIGRPSPQRRPEACVRILTAVSDLATVGWIGGGPASAGRAALEAAGIPVTGWLPRRETQTLLAEADVYLHWTGWDGLPLSILEAMASDVLVVASDIAVNREVLGLDQVCADEAHAAALIRRILSDAALHERLLTEQRERRARYGAARMVRKWIDVYAGVVGRG